MAKNPFKGKQAPAFGKGGKGGKASEMKKFPAKKGGMSGDKPGARKALSKDKNDVTQFFRFSGGTSF